MQLNKKREAKSYIVGANYAAKKNLQTADIYKFCLNVIFFFQKGNIQFWGIFWVETLFQKLWPLLYKRAELGFRLTNVLFSNAQYLDPHCTNNCTCNAYKCLRIKTTTLLFLELFQWRLKDRTPQAERFKVQMVQIWNHSYARPL